MATVLSPRVVPHSLEAEVSVLGCMILDNKTIDTVTQLLKKEDFYSEQNGWVFECIEEMNSKGIPADSLTIAEELKKKDIFEKIGGYSYLTNVADSVFSTSNVEQYCKIIKDKSVKRHMISSLGNIIDACYLERDELETILDNAQKTIYDIALNKTSDFISLPKAMEITISELREVYKNPQDITGISSGYPELDIKTAGFQRGDFILIAARPSMGKTALAVNIAQNAALRDNRSVAVFSLEMSSLQLTSRIISSESEVSASKLKVGKQSVSEWKRISEAYLDIKSKNAKMYIDDTSGITPNELRNKCRKLKATNGLDMIIIDYLQLMTIPRLSDNRQQEISAISRELKSIAKELDCPLIALSQLSRAPESRTNKRPMLSDLRESGAIEQDADLVMMLYRDSYYNPEASDNSTELIITKHRNGETGTVQLDFLNEYTKFIPHTEDLIPLDE